MKPLRTKSTTKIKVENKQDSVFSCEICAKNFQHKGSYTDHLKTHANYDIKYECSECPCFFKNAGHLSVHIREAHNKDAVKKIFECKTCMKSFSSRPSLTEHKRKQHPALFQIFNCKFCQRPYSSKNSLKWHINLNHNKDFKRSKCPYCPCDFKWPHHLKVHIRKAHIEKGYAPSDLLKNGLTSIRRKTNNCIVCREKFEKKFDLMLHLKYIHKQELDIYKCCLCHAVFTLGNSLKLHLDEHQRNKTGTPDHKCDQCYPVSSPKLYESGEKPEPEVVDSRTEIQKEVIDFELSLMENEDIRELIKYRLRHAKRPKRKSKSVKADGNSDFEDFNYSIKKDSDSKEVESPVNGKGKYYCEKCKLHFQMRFSYVTHLKDHTDTESQASTETIEEAKSIVEHNSEVDPESELNYETVKAEVKSPRGARNRALKRKSDDAIETAEDDTVLEKVVALDKGTDVEPKNVVDENMATKLVLLQDKSELSDNEDSKIDMEVRINLARLTDEDIKPKSYKCNDCDKTFALEVNLKEHVRLSHSKTEDLPKRKAINSRYQCTNCKEKFSNPLALNRHMRFESKMKRIQMKKRVVNEIRRYTKHVRLNHRKVNTEPISTKSSVVPVSPRQLSRSEKIYECGKCEIFFNSKLELLRHISDVHMYIKPKISPDDKST